MCKGAIGLFLVLTLVATAGATTIWATDNLGPTNGGTVGDRIIKFDSATPATVTVVGQTNISGTLMGGLDFASNGTLYAYGQTGSVGLYTVNQTNGLATFVGSGGLQPSDSITDLSYDWTTQTMYGIGNYSTSVAPNLYTINLNTGMATFLGALTGMGGTLNVGLATNTSGVNFVQDLVNNGFYKLTGLAGTFLGPEGFDSNYSQGCTVDQATNILYHGAFNAGTFHTELWSVNQTTGVGTFLGQIGGMNPNGLPEYETGDIAIIPEPATLVLLGALALLRRR